MKAVETVEYNGYVIKVYPDEDPTDPREWESLGLMLCKHRYYLLGDVKESNEMGIDGIKEYVKRKDVIALPLYLLDHSGLWMSTGRFACDSGGWDTSMVGYITVTHERVLREYGRKKMSRKLREKAIQVLESEVKTYSDYLEGSAVGYVIEDQEGEHLDSCWGFYPDEHGRIDFMLDECRGMIDGYLKRDEAEAGMVQNVTSA